MTNISDFKIQCPSQQVCIYALNQGIESTQEKKWIYNEHIYFLIINQLFNNLIHFYQKSTIRAPTI